MRAHHGALGRKAGALALVCLLLLAAAVACAAAPRTETADEAPPEADAPSAPGQSTAAVPAAAVGGAVTPQQNAAPPATAGEELIQVREPLARVEPPAATTVAELTAELERTRQQRNRLQVELAAAQREVALWRQRAEALAAGTAEAAQPPRDPSARAGEQAIGEPSSPDPDPGTPRPAEPLDRILPTVHAWADAWSGQQVDEYLSFYSRGFRPPGGLSRREWEALRRERLLAPHFIRVQISSLRAAPAGDGRVRVSFRQSYESDRFNDAVAKELVLVEEEEGAWRIESEQVSP